MVLRLPRPWKTPEDADWLHLTDNEDLRWVGRPSRFTIAFSIIGGLVLALLGIGLTVWLLPVVEATDFPRWLGFIPLVLAIVGVGWVAFVYLNWLRLLYVITDEEIYLKFGLVSRDVTQIRLDRVQNTAFDQSIHERILQYGDVRIYTAGTNTEDITFQSVPNPERVKVLLTELLSDRAGGTGGQKTLSQ